MEKHEYKSISRKRIELFVAKYYNYSFDFEFIDLVAETIENALYDDNLDEAIERSCTYTRDEWTILKKYCSPETANWNEAIVRFNNELTEIYNRIKEITPWED